MKNKISGFTLIEVMIYITLFSFLMGSAFMAAYQLIDGSGKLNVRNTVQEEGNFVMRKMNWALTGVKTIIIPLSGTSPTLSLKKYGGSQVDVRLVGTKIEMKNNGGSYEFLTTDNIIVKASSLNFQYISPSSRGPAGITVTFIITKDNVDFPFTITKYFRK